LAKGEGGHVVPPHLEQALREVQVELPKPRHTLLLVDDEPENLEVLTALLGTSSDVYTAPSGAAALELLATGVAIDLIIADQRMQGMTGVELLAEVARQRPDTVRIVLTAYSDVEPMLDAVNRAGAWRFLVKPYEPEELRATVAEALRAKDNAASLAYLVEVLAARRETLERTLRELSQTQDQLLCLERLSTVGRAAAGIVHNLRNLSTVMSMLMAEIERHPAPESVLGAVTEAQTSMRSLITLLESVRQLAQPEDLDVRREPTNLARFLNTTAALGTMQAGGFPILTETEPDAVLADIDVGRMRQGLLALLDNAIRASAAGEPVTMHARTLPPPAPEPSSASSNQWLCIEVADRGCGMDHATLSRAPEPFFSAFVPPRLGLGLEVARLAVRAHGGRMELESQPGDGTVARLFLPVGLVHAESNCDA
jgi:signal transduction histidine kinase